MIELKNLEKTYRTSKGSVTEMCIRDRTNILIVVAVLM